MACRISSQGWMKETAERILPFSPKRCLDMWNGCPGACFEGCAIHFRFHGIARLDVSCRCMTKRRSPGHVEVWQRLENGDLLDAPNRLGLMSRSPATRTSATDRTSRIANWRLLSCRRIIGLLCYRCGQDRLRCGLHAARPRQPR